MSGAFWALQGLLLLALVVTAVRVELDRRREERGTTRRVPVERRRAASTARADPGGGLPVRIGNPTARAIASLSQFSVRERARLLILRGSVQDARVGQGRLQDDLVADSEAGWIRWAAQDVARPPTGSSGSRRTRVPHPLGSDGASLSDPSMRPVRRPTPPAPRPGRWTGRDWARGIGLLVLVVGLIGVVQVSLNMQALQDANPGVLPRVSLVGRLLPGLIANPAKYLTAVNGASSGRATGGQASLEQIALLQQKQAIDRWEALVLIGAALALSATRGPRTASSGPTPDGVAARESSVADDLMPFIWVVALAFFALSFFELP